MTGSAKNGKHSLSPATVLLLISLALVSALAWQAYQVSRLQYLAAENVLQDYAKLNADELAGRVVREIFLYGLVPLDNALGTKAEAGSESYFTDVERFRAAADESNQTSSRALTLVQQFLYFDAPSATLRSEVQMPKQVNELLQEFLVDKVAEYDGGSDTIYFATVFENRSHMFFMSPLVIENQLTGFSGVQLANDELSTWFKVALDRGPLVPTLMGEDFNNAHLVIWLRDSAGNLLFKNGEFEPYGVSVSKPLGEVYQGLFSGLTIEVSIPAALAPTLVIGGLPHDRLPLLLLLIFLTFLLLLLAGVQIYKERQLTELRKDFVSQVSHELRTPLTHIRMFTETLRLDRIRNEEEKVEALEIIDRETRRLTHLVENILQFSRNERNGARLVAEVCDMVPLMRDVCDEFSSLHPAANLEFTAPAGVKAMTNIDADAMRQVLLNLLDNAAKYGNSDCQIHAKTSVDEDHVTIMIDDNGPGIPIAARERIWDEFYRLPREQESAVAGTGIGLAVVRELVSQLAGKVVAGESDLGGARFTVLLPRVQAES